MRPFGDRSASKKLLAIGVALGTLKAADVCSAGSAAALTRVDTSEAGATGTEQWFPVATLTPSPASPNAAFGWSLASSGTTLVVGSPFQSATNGAAYVFQYDGASWKQSAVLLPADADESYFGYGVAIASGVIAVGAPGSIYLDGGVADPSATYVFQEQADGGWSQTAKLTIGSPGDGFGSQVAVDENWVFATAPYQGTVYTYSLSASGSSSSPQSLGARPKLSIP